MKKLIIICLISALVLAIAGCGKVEEENVLRGTWVDEDGDTLTFNKDGGYESTHYYDKAGTWEIEEETLIFKSNFNELKKQYIIEKEEDKIYLSFDETNIFGQKKDRQFLKQKDK